MNTRHAVVRKSKRQSANAKAQAKKDELITALIETRRKILDATSIFSPIEQDQVFLGIWSIKDLLAHLIGWDATNRKAVNAIRVGKLPDFYAYIDRDWQTYNARLVVKHKRNNLAELISTTQLSHKKLIDSLQAIPAEEFEQDMAVRFKSYKVTIVRLLQAELKDEKVHYTQIEEFRSKAK